MKQASPLEEGRKLECGHEKQVKGYRANLEPGKLQTHKASLRSQ